MNQNKTPKTYVISNPACPGVLNILKNNALGLTMGTASDAADLLADVLSHQDIVIRFVRDDSSAVTGIQLRGNAAAKARLGPLTQDFSGKPISLTNIKMDTCYVQIAFNTGTAIADLQRCLMQVLVCLQANQLLKVDPQQSLVVLSSQSAGLEESLLGPVVVVSDTVSHCGQSDAETVIHVVQNDGTVGVDMASNDPDFAQENDLEMRIITAPSAIKESQRYVRLSFGRKNDLWQLAQVLQNLIWQPQLEANKGLAPFPGWHMPDNFKQIGGDASVTGG